MKLFDASWKRWTFGILFTLVFIIGGAWGGRRYAVPAIKGWRAERMNREARDFLKKGDATNALLTARKILQTQKDNVEAWRIAVAAAKASNTPEVIFYQENLARLEPTKENYLEVIRLSIRFSEGPNPINAYFYAVEAIKNVAKKASDDPEFHALASQVYLRIGPTVAAKYHLVALTQLKPTDRTAQLDLAQILLAEDPGRKDMALRARVRALADEPALRVRALSLLLRESINARLRVETGELVARLQAVPDLEIAQRLLLVEATTMLENSTSPAVLEQLQKEAATKPADAVQVIAFLTRTNQPQKAIAWFATLPEEARKDENVRRAVAEALTTTGNWSALESHLRGAPWPHREHLRQALLAYSFRMQSRPTDFSDAWKAAIAATGTGYPNPKLAELMARVEEWKWVDERYDVIWKLFSLNPTNTTVSQALMRWERNRGDTANLNKIFARIVEADSHNEVMRNNLAYTSLLLDSNIARAGLITSQLVTRHPEDPYYLTTSAFALFKQGNAAEALKRIETLSPAELAEPERMLFHAVFLARTGESSRAAELIKGIDLKRLLPEERQLAENALSEIAGNERTQGNKNRLVAQQNQNQVKGISEAGWLALVAPETRTAASVDMQLSDSLYATSDWKGLQTALRSTDWKADNYLRFALAAYVDRQRDDIPQSEDDWNQALSGAGRNVTRVQNLQRLAVRWRWAPERLETQNVLFGVTPTDRGMLADLLKNYRGAKRTPDLLRVLTLYVARGTESSDEAVALAYYSLLLDANVTRAQVLAKSAFEAAPDDASRRLVYAFSLWKQRRAAEAQNVIADLKPNASSELVPIPLVRAAVDAELGAADDARASLALFDPAGALPEESALAARINAQLAKQADAGKPRP